MQQHRGLLSKRLWKEGLVLTTAAEEAGESKRDSLYQLCVKLGLFLSEAVRNSVTGVTVKRSVHNLEDFSCKSAGGF